MSSLIIALHCTLFSSRWVGVSHECNLHGVAAWHALHVHKSFVYCCCQWLQWVAMHDWPDLGLLRRLISYLCKLPRLAHNRYVTVLSTAWCKPRWPHEAAMTMLTDITTDEPCHHRVFDGPLLLAGSQSPSPRTSSVPVLGPSNRGKPFTKCMSW